METLAGNEANAAMKAVGVIMDLLVQHRNDPTLRDRVEASAACARSAANSAQDAANTCPTPESIRVAKWAQDHAQMAERTLTHL